MTTDVCILIKKDIQSLNKRIFVLSNKVHNKCLYPSKKDQLFFFLFISNMTTDVFMEGLSSPLLFFQPKNDRCFFLTKWSSHLCPLPLVEWNHSNTGKDQHFSPFPSSFTKIKTERMLEWQFFYIFISLLSQLFPSLHSWTFFLFSKHAYYLILFLLCSLVLFWSSRATAFVCILFLSLLNNTNNLFFFFIQ